MISTQLLDPGVETSVAAMAFWTPFHRRFSHYEAYFPQKGRNIRKLEQNTLLRIVENNNSKTSKNSRENCLNLDSRSSLEARD